MKISMWIVADELRDLDPKVNIFSGDMALEDFRFLSAEDIQLEKYVYLSLNNDALYLKNKDDCICFNGVDIFGIMNRIAAIFEKYRNWDSKLHAAVNDSSTPLQTIIDTAHDIFQCPMLFGSIDRHIYAMTYYYEKEDVYEEWDEIKKHHSMPFSLNERLHSFFEENQHIANLQDEKQAIDRFGKE